MGEKKNFNIKQYIILIILLVIFICLFLYLYKTDWYLLRHQLPLRSVSSNPIKRIMIGCPTIDRDILKAQKMYETMKKAIEHLSNFKQISSDIIVITRTSDNKIKEFWNNKANKIILVPHYEIIYRHNIDAISNKMNILASYCLNNNYDALVVIESDVYSNIDTLTNSITCLTNNHVAFAYGNIPWKKQPIVVLPGFLKPQIIHPKKEPLWQRAHGSWTGFVAIRKEVLHNKPFKSKNFENIVGVDVGFYIRCFHMRFRVFVTDYVEHDY
jgi:hypothetical protein